MRLTDIQVKNLKAPDSGSKVYYDDTLKGFGVRVSQAGTKAFILATGKNRDRQTIGRYPHISLVDARRTAQQLIGERVGGKHQPSRLTFGEALDSFLTVHEAANRPGTASEVRRILKKQFLALHRQKLAEVTTHDITKITDKMVDAGHPSAANHAHMAIRNFLHWCVRRRHLQHSPLEGLEKPAPTPSRARVLTDDELKAVWQATEKPTTFNDIIRLCLMTGQRRGEIAALQLPWLENDTLVIPASVAKNGNQHTLPLSQHSMMLATGLATKRHLMKPFSDWSKNKKALDKASGVTGWVIHDCRRSYATSLHRLGIRTEVVEALLNHQSGSKAGIQGVYNRHRYETEMREAVTVFETWFSPLMRKEE